MKNREGYYVTDLERECTNCGVIFPNKSKTVTLCPACNSNRVKGEPPEVRMYRRAKSRATARGIEFTLEKSDIVIPSHCPVLGIPMSPQSGASGSWDSSPALDRVDNLKGYIKGNVLVMSSLANKMKSSATPEQLILFSQWAQREFVKSAEDSRPSVNINEPERSRGAV